MLLEVVSVKCTCACTTQCACTCTFHLSHEELASPFKLINIVVHEPYVQTRSLECSGVMLSASGLNAAEEYMLLFINKSLDTKSVEPLPTVERFGI